MNHNPAHRCPDCDHDITEEQINIEQGMALCADCGALTPLSELNVGMSSAEALQTLGKGASISSDMNGLQISLSLFSLPRFFIGLAIALFWNGIVSMFLSLAVAAVYYNLVGPVPEWFPTPGLSEGVPIMNDEPMGPGITIFVCIFLIPFLVIGIAMIINVVLSLFGTTKVELSQTDGRVSTGISIFRRTKHFNLADVRGVKKTFGKNSQEGNASYVVEITTDSPMTFGVFLSNKQLDWLVPLLRAVLIHHRAPAGTRASWLR